MLQASIAKANDVAEEVLSAVRTTKSFAAENFEAMRFLDYLDHTLSIGAKKAVAHIGFLWTTEVRIFFIGFVKRRFSSFKWVF